MSLGATEFQTKLRDALSNFWAGTLQIEEFHGGHAIAFPLMLPDGLQVVFHATEETPGKVRLSDQGEVLRRLLCEGVNIDAAATKAILDRRLEFYEIQRNGIELWCHMDLPFAGDRIQIFAEGLVGISQMILRHEPVAEEESVGRRGFERLIAGKGLVAKRNYPLEGAVEKNIRVDYFLETARPVAIEVVSRRIQLHQYMQGWGWRWTDLHKKRPEVVRGMIYDPDRQDWDEASMEIGRSVCEIFCPYYDTETLTAKLDEAAESSR
jgi:hypothetical protein